MRKFIRRKEDFKCKKCQKLVYGNGYTNHCPHCLYSLHVDDNPGDRKQLCRGLMVPIEIITKGGEPSFVLHECALCRKIKKNIISSLDSSDGIIKVMEYKVNKEMLK